VESFSVRKAPVKTASRPSGFFRSSTEKIDTDPFHAVPIKNLVEVNEIYEMSEPSEGYESTDNNMEIHDSDFDYGSDLGSEQEMKSQKVYPDRQHSATPEKKSDIENMFKLNPEIMISVPKIFNYDNSSVRIGPMGKSHCFDIAEEESLNNSDRYVQKNSDKILALAHEDSAKRRQVEVEEKVFIRNSQKSFSGRGELELDCEANLGWSKKSDSKKIADRITNGEIFGAHGKSETGKEEQLPDIGSMGDSSQQSEVVENNDQ
jgi:hypothetical protein